VADRLSKAKDGVKDAYPCTATRRTGSRRLVEAFQNRHACAGVHCQIPTADGGLTLHAADTALFYSVDYSFGRLEQARARIHRIGQHNTCTYIYLVARNTIDEDILTALKNKQDIARLVVDEWQTLLDKG
jgi:SNF2 family DNA or RNA helicase